MNEKRGALAGPSVPGLVELHYVCKGCGFESVSVAKPCPECGGSWKRVELAGPESAAEHVRNALQVLKQAEQDNVDVALALQRQPHTFTKVQETQKGIMAARARLVAALAILEGK